MAITSREATMEFNAAKIATAEVINPPIILMKNIKIDLGLGNVQQADKAADKTKEALLAIDQEAEVEVAVIHLKEVLVAEAEATLEGNITTIKELAEVAVEIKIGDVDLLNQTILVSVVPYFHSSSSRTIRMNP